jgi:hypothetical protein
MLMYDRNVVTKQISAAKLERDAFLEQHRNFPTRRCCRCYDIWELLPERFPTYKRQSGGKLYRQTCRFCLRTSARLNDREKKSVLRAPTTMLDGGLPAKKASGIQTRALRTKGGEAAVERCSELPP